MLYTTNGMGQDGTTPLDTPLASLKKHNFSLDLMELHFSPLFLKCKYRLELSCEHVGKHNSFATKIE